MQQPPGHGADVVEELQGAKRSAAIDGTGSQQDFQVRLDLLRGAEGDAEMVRTVLPTSPVPLGEVGRH